MVFFGLCAWTSPWLQNQNQSQSLVLVSQKRDGLLAYSSNSTLIFAPNVALYLPTTGSIAFDTSTPRKQVWVPWPWRCCWRIPSPWPKEALSVCEPASKRAWPGERWNGYGSNLLGQSQFDKSCVFFLNLFFSWFLSYPKIPKNFWVSGQHWTCRISFCIVWCWHRQKRSKLVGPVGRHFDPCWTRTESTSALKFDLGPVWVADGNVNI